MSFISVEPQSRVFLESHSNSLLTKFDKQLEIVADRYLAFFQERRRIEVSYIDSLRKLHREAKVVDASFDPSTEPTTTRTAWEKVRDNLEGEANAQQAFVDVLDNDVIKPLAMLKETEDQTRQRVEKDLEDSAAQYSDHAENTILKLQQAYLKKYQPRQYPHPNDVQRPEDGLNRRLVGRVSALFRGWQEDSQGSEPATSEPEEVSSDHCRRAVGLLNTLRLKRVENLEDGYNCLEELVFAPTIDDVLVRYMDVLVSAHTKSDNLAMSTKAEVEKALTGTDASDLRESFSHALSFSIPPLALYCNHRPSYSDLVFGVPLVGFATNQDNVPKAIRICLEEVEKRGLDAHKIYSVGSIYDPEILQLRRRFESERNFSFSSNDNIHSVAMLLKLYLWDLPEPLFMLTLGDYRDYGQNRARYTENDCSVLRPKIRELHPNHRASLEDLLRHLLLVSSHSDKNAMTVEALAAQFCYTVLRGNAVLEGGAHAKKLVMEDLIRNAHVLFDERPPPSPPVPSQMAETTSYLAFDSLLGAESPPSAGAQAVGSTSRHQLDLVDGIPTLIQPSFTASHSDSPVDGRLSPTLAPLLNPLLGLSTGSSQTLRERSETITQEEVIPEPGSAQAVETSPNSSPPEVVPVTPTSVGDRWLPQPGIHQRSESPTIPQSPSDSMISSTSDLSSASLLSSPTQNPSSANLRSAFFPTFGERF